MTEHAASQDDREFRDAFESLTIAPARFDHKAHLRLAYVYLVDNDLPTAQQRMRDALRAFISANGIAPEKFHETLTRAWVLAVRHFMSRSPSRSFAEFIAKSQRLMDSRVMLVHYSAERLFSAQARAAFVEPDRAAIPG